MSLGFKSARRLTGLSWLDALPPAAAAVMAFMLLPIASFAITSPSTTIKGSTPPLIVVTPRKLICPPPPGAPEFIWITAPGTLPCSALSSVWVGARVSCSAFTVVTALARLRRSTAVAWPVMTTASTLKTSCSSRTSTRLCSGATASCRCFTPTLRINSARAPTDRCSVHSHVTSAAAQRGVRARARRGQHCRDEHAGQADLATLDLEARRAQDEQDWQGAEHRQGGGAQRHAERTAQRRLGMPQLQQRPELERQRRAAQQHVAREQAA